MADPGQAEPALIDVVVADDHAMVRAGLRLLLETSPRIRVVAEAGGVESALAAVRADAPDVAILDLNMPGGGALPAIPRVLEAVPGVRIVVLTMEEDPALAREAMVAGARAYVLKDAADVELIEAVLAAADGRTYLNPRLGAQLAATTDAEDALPIGSTFAGHRIDALAGRGGMAVVYRATDMTLDRPVALKLVAPALARDPTYRARFEAECRLAASIDDPHVVPVYRAGEERGRLFLTMRFIEGSDLRSLLEREGRMEPRRSVDIVSQVCEGLQAAHERGLVHRDVKPGNVLVAFREGRERAYLTDFGLTIDRARARHLTATGMAIGTAAFMAPEQAQGGTVDPRTDVYALACVLFRALTGILPYERTSELDTLWAHVHEPPPRLRDVAPELPAALGTVLERALSKAPGDRQQSAAEFGNDALDALT